MLKQLNAGVVSLGMLSTMAAPVLAQDAFHETTQNESILTSKVSVEQQTNSYPNTFYTEESLDSLAVKNTLNFNNINFLSEDPDLLAQRRTRSTRSKYKYSAGLDTINFGWVKDNNGAISSVLGFNISLGVAYRKYFKPTEDGKFNFSWDVGTFLVILPFAGIGADYQWDSGWYVGARALVLPAVFFIDDFLFPVLPTISGGYRWK